MIKNNKIRHTKKSKKELEEKIKEKLKSFF